jgi:hypothetical protein
MVVLDEHAVVEAEAVIAPAAAGDRVLLEQTETWCRLASVEDRDSGTCHGVDVASRECRDS